MAELSVRVVARALVLAVTRAARVAAGQAHQGLLAERLLVGKVSRAVTVAARVLVLAVAVAAQAWSVATPPVL